MARKKVEEEREEEEDRVGEGCCGLTVCKYTLCVYNFISESTAQREGWCIVVYLPFY